MNRLALLVAGAFFMEFLDGTIIVPALPHMAASLGTTAVGLQAAVSAYMLTVAVCILPSGWLAQRYGVRPVFTLAVVLFTAASALCGWSQSPGAFVAARVLQGVGGAMMVPVGRLAVLRSTPKDRIVHAMALLTWPALSAPLVGPPLGGFLADYLSWRWIFLVNLPLGVVATLLSLRLMPDVRDPARPPFDWVGFAWAAAAIAAASVVFDFLADRSASAASVAVPALVAVLATALLWRHIRRHAHPIVELSAFRIQTFRLSLLEGTGMRVLISAMPFLLPLMIQLGWGRSASEAGTLTLALFVGNIGIKPLTTPIMRRWGFRTVLFVNGLVQAASMALCALLGPGVPLPVVLAAFVLAGASRSMQFTALNTLIYADVPERTMGMANLLFSVAFQLAAGFGIAAGAVVLRAWAASAGHSAPLLADFHGTLLTLAVLMAAASLRVLTLPVDAGAVVSGAGRR